MNTTPAMPACKAMKVMLAPNVAISPWSGTEPASNAFLAVARVDAADMVSFIEERLARNGMQLPKLTQPIAQYVAVKKSHPFLFVSGQLPSIDGTLITGTVEDTISIEQAQKAAQICALNSLAQVINACDNQPPTSLSCLRLGGYVACRQDFTQHPKIIDAASNVIRIALAENGAHSRIAVGSPSLPLGACVEIDAALCLLTPPTH